MKTKMITIIALVLLFTGCQKNIDVQSSNSIKQFSIKIISEPSGAKIEVNDNYVGKTPLTIKIDGWEETRTFIRRNTIIAHPIRAGGEMQMKFFSGWYQADKTYGDVIPKKIYFNMNLVRTPQKMDLNIHK